MRRKTIALTFDDGPNTTTTLEVLKRLKKYQVVASFFVVGRNINEETSEVIRKAYEMGCEINNHGWTHSDMTVLDRETIEKEVQDTSNKVYEAIGMHTKYFRPPYISVDDRMYDVIAMPFICGYGCEDYDENISVEERVTRTLAQAKDGGIILLHDAEGNSLTVAALDQIIPALKKEGYEFVTVSRLFEEAGVRKGEEGRHLYSSVR